jgi:hypothetical protein
MLRSIILSVNKNSNWSMSKTTNWIHSEVHQRCPSSGIESNEKCCHQHRCLHRATPTNSVGANYFWHGWVFFGSRYSEWSYGEFDDSKAFTLL